MNTRVQIPLWDSDFIFFGYIPRSEIAGSYSSLFLIWGGTATLFSIIAAPVSIPTISVQDSFFSRPSPTLLISSPFIINILMGVRCYDIVLTCISLMNSNIEHLFIFPLLLVCLFGKMCIQVICLFFNQFICFLLCFVLLLDKFLIYIVFYFYCCWLTILF